MAVSGLSRQLGSSEAAKLWNKILSSKSALLIPTVSRSAFHSANLFLFSHHHIPTNSVAPFAAYKPNTIHYSSNRSDEGLMLETLNSKLFKVATSRFQLSCYTLPRTQHHSFLRNLPPLCIKLIFVYMVNYWLAQKRVGCYGDNLLPKVMSVEYLKAYITTAVSI